jgi:Flp pilus assembly protein TadD
VAQVQAGLAAIGSLLGGGTAGPTATAPSPPPGANPAFARGQALTAAGDLRGAIDAYAQAIAENPQHAEAFRERARAHNRLQNFAAGRADADRAIALNPRDAVAFNLRGNARSRLSDTAGAAADYSQAIELDAKYASPLTNRGTLRLTSGDLPGARQDYDRALALAPGDVNSLWGRGDVKTRAGDLAGAVADYDLALVASPRSTVVLSNRGQALLQMGKYPEALASLNRALEIDPRYVNALVNRGLTKAKLGDGPGATADLEQALKLEPGSVRARTALSEIRQPATVAGGSPTPLPPKIVALPAAVAPLPAGPAFREVSAPDGVRAAVTAATAPDAITIRRVEAPASSAAAEDSRPASAVYEVKAAKGASEPMLLALPIDRSLLPAGEAAASLTPQVYDARAGAWRTASRLAVRDAERNQILFSIAPDPEVGRNFRLGYAFISSERTYASRRFVIHFYPREARNRHVVLTDEEWLARLNQQPTGNAVIPGVPDFIEDLAVACEKVYDALLAIRNSGGQPVFRELGLPQHIYVRDCKGSAGESPLGGPLQISNTQIENRANGVMNAWEDLTHVLAHEMVHVFQGQYYYAGIFANAWNGLAPGNRWFIEATANYLATLACQSGPVVKKEFYTKDGHDQFLFAPLPANLDQSYYTAGYFLEWASRQYGAGLVGDILARGGGDDLANLEAELRRLGEAGGLGGAYEKFLLWLAPRPEGVGKFHAAIKQKLSARTSEVMARRGSHDNFSVNSAYLRLEHDLAPLSSALVSLACKPVLNQSSLLVCDPRQTSIAAGNVRFLTYGYAGDTDAGYASRRPLEAGVSNPGVSPYVLPDYGFKRTHGAGFEQLIYNPQATGQGRVVVEYYLLQPPIVSLPRAGSVAWSTVEVWNIPLEIIAGYQVYCDGVKLTADLVPYTRGQASLTHAKITDQSKVHVAVVDRLGHVWPEYAGISPPRVQLKPGTGTEKDPSVAFQAAFSEPINGAPVQAEWRVVGASAGTITPNGRYRAPNRPGLFEVEVINRNNPRQVARARVEVKEEVPAPAAPGPTVVAGGWRLVRTAKTTAPVIASNEWDGESGIASVRVPTAKLDASDGRVVGSVLVEIETTNFHQGGKKIVTPLPRDARITWTLPPASADLGAVWNAAVTMVQNGQRNQIDSTPDASVRLLLNGTPVQGLATGSATAPQGFTFTFPTPASFPAQLTLAVQAIVPSGTATFTYHYEAAAR